jgi:hypothetical protein
MPELVGDAEILKALVLKVSGVGNREVVAVPNQHSRTPSVFNGFRLDNEIEFFCDAAGVDGKRRYLQPLNDRLSVTRCKNVGIASAHDLFAFLLGPGSKHRDQVIGHFSVCTIQLRIVAMKLICASERLEVSNPSEQVVDGHVQSVGQKMEVVEGRFFSSQSRNARWRMAANRLG